MLDFLRLIITSLLETTVLLDPPARISTERRAMLIEDRLNPFFPAPTAGIDTEGGASTAFITTDDIIIIGGIHIMK